MTDLESDLAVTSAPLGHEFSRELPAIKNYLRILGLNSDLVQVGEKMFEEKRILYADSNFLNFFSFPLLAGDPATALLQPESIIITKAMAKKYFGTEEALGKIIP